MMQVKSLPQCPAWNKLIGSPFPPFNAMIPNTFCTLESCGVLLKNYQPPSPIPKQLYQNLHGLGLDWGIKSLGISNVQPDLITTFLMEWSILV